MSVPFRLAALGLALAAVCLPLFEARAAEPLTLRGAIGQALAVRPELRGFAYAYQARDAAAAAAALRPQPQGEFLLEDFAGSGTRRGLDGYQATLSVSQVLELGDKRSARQAVAAAAGDGLHSLRAARQLDIVAEVARHYYEVLDRQLRLAAAQDALAASLRTEAQVERRVLASRAPPAERSRATARVVDARLVLEDAEHELVTARHSLAISLGSTTDGFGQLEGDLLDLPEIVPFEALVARLDATPELLAFADEARLRESELRLAELRRRPDPRVTFGLRRYGQGEDLGFIAGVALPLGSRAAAAPAVDAARAARGRVEVDREAAWLKLQERLFVCHQQLEHARHVADTLRRELIPLLERALAETEYAYERGRYAYTEWARADEDLRTVRLRLIAAANDFHTLRVEIERLTALSTDAGGDLP